MVDEDLAVRGVLENPSVGRALTWHIVQAIMCGELLGYLPEVGQDILLSQASRDSWEDVLVLDVDEGEDLMQLEGDLEEAAEVLVVQGRLIFEAELLVLKLSRKR